MPGRRGLKLLILFCCLICLTAPAEPPLLPAPEATKNELWSAFSQRLQGDAAIRPLAFDLFAPELDTAFLTADGKTAVLWLALRDDYGRRLATEPGLALARQNPDGWQILLPTDPQWQMTLDSLPPHSLPAEIQPLAGNSVNEEIIINAPLTGYYLPYAAGTAKWMEGSISHFQSIPELGYPSCSEVYCRYAYDFTDYTPFPLLASKEGYVLASRDSCTDGSPTCTNYIVLHNRTEDTYQIYLHLAHGTIPDKLTPGTFVQRGQYIGDSDDTGYSTSQHVHFMVVHKNTLYFSNSGYYWGRSIDIRFADVPINNGIPRNCYEVTRFPIYDGATECLGNKLDPRNPANDWYVSGNVGAFPPSGSLTRPAAGATLLTGTGTVMDVSATASDDVRVTAVRLVVRINDQWVEAGQKVSTPVQTGQYDWDVDLCSVGPLNGDVEIALRVWDHEGNVAAALNPRTIHVDHACPPSSSQLKPAEVFDSTAVRLSWDGFDNGAGFGGFDLQWRPESGAWQDGGIIRLPAYQRSVWFVGEPGQSYAFRLRAVDINGQPENWPAGDAAETTAALPLSCQADEYEPDDSPSQARLLSTGETVIGNLCPQNNGDGFRITIDQPGNYLLSALSQSGGAAVRLRLFDENGLNELATAQAPAAGENTFLRFEPTAPATYYLKVEPLQPNLFGSQAVYRLNLWPVQDTFLPLISR
ncbi:MAG: hypothetical protein KatS3mg047_0040 [Bellilinea sp.]|nr:MAG: hypothetical protein KatS3mg047_0040 [Bellilinea sp.]